MISQEIASSWSRVGLVVLSSIAMLGGIITYVRIIGLRSFSKMSSFDFAVTVAFGSLLAAVAMSRSSLVDGLVAAATMLGVQALIAVGRSRIGLSSVVDNRPRLLMAGGTMLHENLRRTRVTVDDVKAKLREANVLNYDQIQAVVLETTGEISVLHGDGPLDPDLFTDVVDASELDAADG